MSASISKRCLLFCGWIFRAKLLEGPVGSNFGEFLTHTPYSGWRDHLESKVKDLLCLENLESNVGLIGEAILQPPPPGVLRKMMLTSSLPMRKRFLSRIPTWKFLNLGLPLLPSYLLRNWCNFASKTNGPYKAFPMVSGMECSSNPFSPCEICLECPSGLHSLSTLGICKRELGKSLFSVPFCLLCLKTSTVALRYGGLGSDLSCGLN